MLEPTLEAGQEPLVRIGEVSRATIATVVAIVVACCLVFLRGGMLLISGAEDLETVIGTDELDQHHLEEALRRLRSYFVLESILTIGLAAAAYAATNRGIRQLMAEPNDAEKNRDPVGIPEAQSSARRRVKTGEEELDGDSQPSKAPVPSLASNAGSTPGANGETPSGNAPKRPVGLKNMTTSARLRLQLAFDDDDDDEDSSASEAGAIRKRPVGLKNMTTSARLRLELALDHDDDETIPPPKIDPRRSIPGARPEPRLHPVR